MSSRSHLYRTLLMPVLLGALTITTSALAQQKPNADPTTMFGAMFDGAPKLATTQLHPSAYVETRVQKLANAQIAYVNWEAVGEILQKLGYANPPTELTPEVAQAILSKAGFAKPVAGEPPSAYTEAFRELYSIRYGGHYLNNNFGSGRNGAGGVVDSKGIGITELVRPWSDGGHGGGTMHLPEAIKEAIFSNLLHQELPFGANRVLFILTTGTNVRGNAPDAEPRAILVREDPMRPAYFQQNGGVVSDDMWNMSQAIREYHQNADNERMRQLFPNKMIDALPSPKGMKKNATPEERLRLGYLEMTDRLALVYATAYSRQVMLGGVSTSNTDITGAALDFGTTNAVVGFPNAMILAGETHGSSHALKNDVILELARDLREVLPENLIEALPTDDELSERVDREFQKRVLQNMLELVGTPKELSPELIESQSGKALAEVILKIAKAGEPDLINMNMGQMPGRTGTYNLGSVLRTLLESGSALHSALPDARLRGELQSSFANYRPQLVEKAATHGVSEISLQTYMKKAVRARNRAIYGLVGNQHREGRVWRASGQFAKGHLNAVQTFIDGMVERSIREFKTSEPFQIMTRDRKSSKGSINARETFDARSNSSSIRRSGRGLTCQDSFG